MKRRSSPRSLNRCDTCGLSCQRCLCAGIAAIDTKVHVTVVMHQLETRRASNSGKLLCHALKNSTIKHHGSADGPLDLNEVVKPGWRNILLYPVTNRTEPPEGSEPLNLIIPDGNWKQASKIARRLLETTDVVPVSLPYLAPSRYRLRSAPTRPEGLATFEACARFLGCLEGKEIEESLLRTFDDFVHRHLHARAKLGPKAPATLGSQL